jgi:hypothetical protein
MFIAKANNRRLRGAGRPSPGVLKLAAEFSKPRGTPRGFSGWNAPKLNLFQRLLAVFEQLRSIEPIFPASTAERLYWHEIAVTITLVAPRLDTRNPEPLMPA